MSAGFSSDSVLDGDLEAFDPYEGCEVLRSLVEHALAPYASSLLVEDLEDLRDFLIVVVTTHPAVEPLYAALRERQIPGQSGTSGGEEALSQTVELLAKAVGDRT